MTADISTTSIPWLRGQALPGHWSETKVKYLAPGMQAGENITSDDIESEGAYPVFGGNGFRGYTESFTHSGTRLLIGRQGALCGNVHLVQGEFWASEHAIVAEVAPAVDARWLSHLLRVMNLGQYSQTSAQPGIGTRQIGALDAPLPPPDEQRAIADYLDRETSQIDELIADQRRLIALLVERSEAVAAEILGSRVGSGERLRWHLVELDVRAGARAHALPLLSVSISWGVRRRDEVSNDEARAEDLSNYKVCSAGDLVINRMRAFQGALGLAPEDGVVSPDYSVLRTTPDVDPAWLVAAMKTPVFVAEMAQRVKGVGSVDLGNARTPRISISDLGEIRLDVPDLAQQAGERAEFERQLSRIGRLMREAERFIELSRERRSALITAAVTGRIQVDEAV